jgi:hypothetical protein
MTQDEIIEMARQVGFKVSGELVLDDMGYVTIHHRLGDFAKLVAAKEREACAKVCDELPAPDIYSDTDKSMWDVTCIDCADAIRARGQA